MAPTSPQRARHNSAVRIETLVKELLLVYRKKSIQLKLHNLNRLHHDPQACYASFKKIFQNVEADVLNKYAFDATSMATVAAVTREMYVEGSHEALRAVIWQARVDEAVEMQQELLKRFSAPEFQAKLRALHESHHPYGRSFGEHFADLLAGIYAQVLPKYGFAGNQEGLELMTLAMGRMMSVAEVQVLATMIDSVLYGATAPQTPEVSRYGGGLGRQQVLQLLREQLALFSIPDFQHQMNALRTAMHGDSSGLEAGRAELALTHAQQEILPRFGLEANLRGVHSMLQICAKHILDPEVARLTFGIHSVLGIDEPEAIVERLRDMQAEVPLPSLG